MKNIYLVFILFYLQVATSQTPILIADLNPGNEESSYGRTYIKLNDALIYTATDGITGTELYKVDEVNGIRLLKDINEGTSHSYPSEFTLYNGKVYFFANDGSGDGSLWETDGTSSGTKKTIELGSNSNGAPRGLIVSRLNEMYFTHGGQLYLSDGTETGTQPIMTSKPIDFDFEWNQQSPTYTLYNDGVAFLTEASDFVELWKVENGVVEMLGTKEIGFSYEYYGLVEVEKGLYFSISFGSSSTFNGLYFYDKSTSVTSKVSDIPPSRVVDFDQNRCIILSSGYQILNGDLNNTEELIASGYADLFSGSILPIGIKDGKAFLFASDAVYYSDGTAAGTTKQTDLEPYVSPVIIEGKYAIWADGTSNLFDPSIWYGNLEDGSTTKLYQYSDSSRDTDSVVPLGVLGNKLYFLSNMDSDVGKELYSIELNINTSVRNLNTQSPYNLLNIGNNFTIKSNKGAEKFDVYFYDTSSKLVERTRAKTNEVFSFEVVPNIYVIKIIGKEGIFSKKVFIK